jgi:hypothetical protein
MRVLTRHGPAGSARAAPDRSPAQHHSRHGSSRPDQYSAQKCDSVCSSEPTCPSSSPLGKPIIERPVLPKSRRSRFADDDSAGIPPKTIQHSVTGMPSSCPGRRCTKVHCSPETKIARVATGSAAPRRAELGRAARFSSLVAANGHGISDEFRVERRANGDASSVMQSALWMVVLEGSGRAAGRLVELGGEGVAAGHGRGRGR